MPTRLTPNQLRALADLLHQGLGLGQRDILHRGITFLLRISESSYIPRILSAWGILLPWCTQRFCLLANPAAILDESFRLCSLRSLSPSFPTGLWLLFVGSKYNEALQRFRG